MPEKILELLKNGSLTEEQLAEKLNISLNELRACMEYLQNIGFIKSQVIYPNRSSCSGNCGKCSSSCNAVSHSSYKIWEII